MKAVHPRRQWVFGFLAAILLLVGFPRHAPAQMGMGFGDPSSFSTPVTARSLNDYGTILSLTPEQKDALKSLHEGYLAAHAELMKDMQKAMAAVQEKFQETQDMKVWQKEFPKQMKELAGRGEKLEKGFYDDLKALLDAKQQESWASVERHRRRENGLRFGFVSGQAVDLVKVIDTLKLDPKAVPGLADQLDQYEQAMDRSVQAFEKFGKDQQKRSEEWADFDMSDMTKMQAMMTKVKDMMKEMVEHAKAMRDVNRQYARTIEPMLPEESRAKFQAEFNRRAHPRIYRQSWVSKAMGAAEGFADLGAEQKGTIAAMKSEYQRDAEAANKRWASLMEEQEEKTGGQMMEMMSMWGGAADAGVAKAKEETNKARADRKDLDKRVKEKLLALLNEEQKGRLPEEQKEPAGMFGMMGGDMFAGPDEEEAGK